MRGATVTSSASRAKVLSLSATIRLRIEMPREQGSLDRSGNAIEAPLHGVVSQLHVALGDTVEKGAPVLQMEAMKLIHTLRAPVAGPHRADTLQRRGYRSGGRYSGRNYAERS